MNPLNTTFEFKTWPKIPRLLSKIVITEKLDGTNACVYVSDDLSTVGAQSRSQILTPTSDNHGFAKWVQANQEELKKLGPGYHHGEWVGSGIQRGYGLSKGEKKFFLFNVHRWAIKEARPACCECVPILYQSEVNTEKTTQYETVYWEGINYEERVLNAIELLEKNGSVAFPGFMRPEGIVLWHDRSQQLFKFFTKHE